MNLCWVVDGSKAAGANADCSLAQTQEHPWRYLRRSWRRPHAVRSTDEKLVAKSVAQTVQSVTDRRLGQSQTLGARA